MKILSLSIISLCKGNVPKIVESFGDTEFIFSHSLQFQTLIIKFLSFFKITQFIFYTSEVSESTGNIKFITYLPSQLQAFIIKFQRLVIVSLIRYHTSKTIKSSCNSVFIF